VRLACAPAWAPSPRRAAVAGLAGALSVQLQAVADPSAYDPFLSFKLLVAVLLGGAAATLGPAAGVIVLGLIGLSPARSPGALQLPLERFDTAVAALLLVFVLALRRRRACCPGPARLLAREAPPRGPGRSPPRCARAERAGPRRARPAQGLRRRVAVDDFSLELRAARRGADRAERLRQDDGAAADLRRRRPDAGRSSSAAPTSPPRRPERVRLGIARTLQATAVFPS
jgi:hypothetical protein